MNINELTIQDCRILLDSKKITSLELTKRCLEKIKNFNRVLNACILVDEQGACEAAIEADKRMDKGEKGGLLGIPYLCKDNIMVKGMKVTAASKMLNDYVAPYDATVIKKLKAAGAVLLGKTNLDEFAHGASTEHSAFGRTLNPLDISRTPGGSSGGSAAAVAANMCIFALGSDTGGSIRQPASFCGVVGLKPSYGRVSRHGLLSMTSSTDVIGPITKTALDAATVLKFIAGRDNLDATTLDYPVDDYDEIIVNNLLNIKIGIPLEYFEKSLNPKIMESVFNVVQRLKSFGAEIVDVTLPYTKYGVPAYYLITPAEISSNLARFDGVAWGFQAKKSSNLLDFYQESRGQGFGSEVKRRIMLGTYSLSAGYYDEYYKKAQKVRELIISDFNRVFSEVDLLITPTTPHPAFKIGKKDQDPLSMYLEDIFVTTASLAGLAAISIPEGEIEIKDGGLNIHSQRAKSLPIGVQIIAPKLKESLLLKAALRFRK